jgi:CRP/FNR family transcriptional regulator, cyclic AMP receptor protein
MTTSGTSITRTRMTTWYIKKSPLFVQAAYETVKSFSMRLRTSQYARGARLFATGRTAANTYILLRGSVKVSHIEPDDGKELVLYLVKPGEPFGTFPFTTRRDPEHVTVAHQKSLIGFIRTKEWERFYSEDREFCFAIHRVAATRMKQMEERMMEIAYRDIDCRLARLLIRLSSEYPVKCDCGVQIGLPFTQQDISDFIAATRETTSLAINEFKRNGWIAMHNRRICIHKPRSLRRIAV